MILDIIHGPNLNLLGHRQPELYGTRTFEDYLHELQETLPSQQIRFFQSNHEGELIDRMHMVRDDSKGILLNAGAYTHTSIALVDAILSIGVPVMEIHLSNIYSRENFRRHSMIAPYCIGSICGLGLEGYKLALDFMITRFS